MVVIQAKTSWRIVSLRAALKADRLRKKRQNQHQGSCRNPHIDIRTVTLYRFCNEGSEWLSSVLAGQMDQWRCIRK